MFNNFHRESRWGRQNSSVDKPPNSLIVLDIIAKSRRFQANPRLHRIWREYRKTWFAASTSGSREPKDTKPHCRTNSTSYQDYPWSLVDSGKGTVAALRTLAIMLALTVLLVWLVGPRVWHAFESLTRTYE